MVAKDAGSSTVYVSFEFLLSAVLLQTKVSLHASNILFYLLLPTCWKILVKRDENRTMGTPSCFS